MTIPMNGPRPQATSDSWVMRPARRAEALEVANLWLRSRKASTPAIPTAVHGDDEVRAWFTEVVLPTREVWVVDGPGLVAMMVTEASSIDQLYVDPDWTSQGLGSRLVNHAKARYPQGLALWTFQSNHAAHRFYERHGFVATGTTDGANEESSPDVRYEWTGAA